MSKTVEWINVSKPVQQMHKNSTIIKGVMES